MFRPRTEDEVAAVVRWAASEGMPLTPSGARTGIVGGAVPDHGGGIISLEGLDTLSDPWIDAETGRGRILAGAGVSLDRLRRHLADTPLPAVPGSSHGEAVLHYPVDPTEWSATVGGTVATNAAGGRSFRYGPTAPWVKALHLVTAEGKRQVLRRGEVVADAHGAQWDALPGSAPIPLPGVHYPEVRCVAGYPLTAGSDLVDLLVGSEGTLAIVTAVELELIPPPAATLSLAAFLPEGRGASGGSPGLALVPSLRNDPQLRILAIEYLDQASLALIREEGQAGWSGDLPAPPDGVAETLFIELALEPDPLPAPGPARVRAVEEALFEALARLEEHLAQAGGSLEATWAGDSPMGRARLRSLRHAVPEIVNARISRVRRTVPTVHKVGTDLALPDRSAFAMEDRYAEVRAEAGMPSVLFGHAAENHLHLNFLPRTEEELERARSLHLALAREAVRLGGSVTAEHGVGRLKHPLVEIQFGPGSTEAFHRVRARFDPQGILNPGAHLPPLPSPA